MSVPAFTITGTTLYVSHLLESEFSSNTLIESLLQFSIKEAWAVACSAEGLLDVFCTSVSDDHFCYELALDSAEFKGCALYLKLNAKSLANLGAKIVVPSNQLNSAFILFKIVSKFFDILSEMSVCNKTLEVCHNLKDNLIALKKQIRLIRLASKLYDTLFSQTDHNSQASESLFTITSTDCMFAYWRDPKIKKDYCIEFEKLKYPNTAETKYFLSIKTKESDNINNFESGVWARKHNAFVVSEWTLLEYFAWDSIAELEHMLTTTTYKTAFGFLLNSLKEAYESVNEDSV